jgi:hypothetical protein
MYKEFSQAFINKERSYSEGGTTAHYKKQPKVASRAVTKSGDLKDNIATFV